MLRLQQRDGFLWAICLAIVLCGCGYVGDPLPPALYIPLPVSDLRVQQEADVLGVQFVLPARSTEDVPLGALPEVDLRIAAWENREWDEGAWEREAVRLSTLTEEGKLQASARTPATPWEGKRVVLRVRAAGRSGRFSAWSDPVALRVIPRRGGIMGFGVASNADGIRVHWSLPNPIPGMVTEIYRRTAEGDEFALLSAVPGDEWIDRTAQRGESYSYRIRVRVEGDERNFVGEYPEVQTITYVDRFAPAAPADVAAVAGATGVELSWTRNQEPDFQAYKVYRSVDGVEFSTLGDATPTPAFSDASAPTGVPLRYRVTSLDVTGNESEPSETAELRLP